MRSGSRPVVPVLAGLAAATLLLACGGGGGDDGPSTVSLSGTIDIPADLTVDADVNDPGGQNGPEGLNDSLARPQAIASPVSLAGHVNRPGAGASGATQIAGDVDDYYRVTLQAGQTVVLGIGDPAIPSVRDLDLELLDEEGVQLDLSAGVGQRESVEATSAGSFVVRVFAVDGASNYTLSVGQGLTLEASLRMSDPFVPGELIVRPMDAGAVSAQSLGARVGGRAGRNQLWRLPEAGAVELMALSEPRHLEAGRHVPDSQRERWRTLMAAKALRSHPDIRFADLNYWRYPLLVPDDPGFEAQWHYPLINLPEAWDVTVGVTASPGVSPAIVAVVDTGILPGHPDAPAPLVDGFDFVSDPTNAGDGDGRDPDPTDPGDNAAPGGRSSFHGTHVAGTVAAATDNATGVAGVAWDAARIMPLRALGRLGGSSFDVQQAVLYAAGLDNASNRVPSQRADVINLSLGGPGSSASDQAVIDQVRAAGVIVIAAAGNEGSSTPIFPASYQGVVSVSAVAPDVSRAYYSNFGSNIDVAAPGGDMRADRDGDGFPDGVLSIGGDDSEGGVEFVFPFQQGTSMAAPHVAGVAALMEVAARAAGMGDLSPADFDSLLQGGSLTTDLGAAGRDDAFGHGLIDARRAVLAAGTSRTEPVLGVSPGSFNLGATGVPGLLQVTNLGGGDLIVTGVTDDAASPDWLTVTEASVNADGTGSYQVAVDRSVLGPGTFEATITVASDAGDATVPVRVTVPEAGGADANAGRHFVLLVDLEGAAAPGRVVAQVEVTASGGKYPFTFSGVTAGGDYQVVAGTDFDNDGFICDPGEACGAFPTLDRPTVLEDQTSSRSGLDFFTGFQVELIQQAATGESGQRRGWPLRGSEAAGRRLP